MLCSACPSPPFVAVTLQLLLIRVLFMIAFSEKFVFSRDRWVIPVRFGFRPFHPLHRLGIEVSGCLHCGNIAPYFAGGIVVLRKIFQSECLLHFSIKALSSLLFSPLFFLAFTFSFLAGLALLPANIGSFVKRNHDIAKAIFDDV